MSKLVERLGLLGAGFFGGGVGAGLVGALEAIALGGNSLWYALGLYGAAGAAGGTLLAAPFALLRPRTGAARLFGNVAGLALLAVSLPVLAFLLLRNVFEDRTTPAFWAVFAAASVLSAGVALALSRAGARSPRLDCHAFVALSPLFAAALALAGWTGVDRSDRVTVHSTAPAVAPTRGPNVLLVVMDALRADALGSYGGPPTPRMDALAAEGSRFPRAVAQSSWTRPCIATVLTSLLQSGHGVAQKGDRLPAELPTLQEVMRGAGLRTASVQTNPNLSPFFGFERGFDTYHYLAPTRYLGAPVEGAELAFYKLYRLALERTRGGAKDVATFYQDGPRVTAASLETIDELEGSRFFMYVHYMDTHDPFFKHPYDGTGIARMSDPNPPASRLEEMRALYAGEVQYADQAFGALVDGLKQRGLWDETIVVLTADHGEEFLEHGGYWHGTTLYEELVHVPLIVKPARSSTLQLETAALARHLDIAPTLAALVGAEPPPSWLGVPLDRPDGREQALAEVDHQGQVLSMIRHADTKLITANAGNPRGLPQVALFDLATDAREKTNLAEQHAEEVARLTQRLARTLERSPGTAEPARDPGGERRDASVEEQLRSLGYVQ